MNSSKVKLFYKFLLIRIAILYCALVCLFPNVSAARGAGGFVLKEDIQLLYTRLERSSSAGSLSLLSETGMQFGLWTGVSLSRSWWVYLEGQLGTFTFVGPSSRTIQDSNGTTFLGGLGVMYAGRDAGFYLQGNNEQFVTVTDVNATTHTLTVNKMTTGELGFVLKAKSRLGYEMSLDLSGTVPTGKPEVGAGEAEWSFSATAKVNLEFGKKPLMYGFSANMRIDEFKVGTDEYSSNKVYAGLYLNFLLD